MTAHFNLAGVFNSTHGGHDSQVRGFEKLQELVSGRNHGRTGYYCVVPVSGGKDSIYQVVRAIELGMRVLAVNAVPLMRTSLGQRNLNVIKELNCDVIEFDANRSWRRSLSRSGLLNGGIPNWPQHLLSVTVPFRVALDLETPFMLWGENPEYEYGGPRELTKDTEMTREWFERRGGLGSLTSDFMISDTGINFSGLKYWTFPEQSEIEGSGLQSLYLGMFEDWKGTRNTYVSQALGFVKPERPTAGSLYDFENLDDPLYLIHDFLKFVKFGYGRCSDQASILVREGSLDRNTAWSVASRQEGFWPQEYLDVPLKAILTELEVSELEFAEVCAKFAHPKLFRRAPDGSLMVDGDGRLICSEILVEARSVAELG